MKTDKASSTAYTVIHGLLHTAKDPRFGHLVDEETVEACRLILGASTEGQKRLKQLDSPLKSRILQFLEWLLLPGVTLNYALRKKYIEEQTLKALDSDVTQVVNIGAGFDTLAWRLSKRFPTVTFIEIDHPATGREKQMALAKENGENDNLHFLNADLSRISLKSVLSAFRGFDPGKKTLYICEGVLMYLDEKHVIDLLNTLQKLSGPGTRFLFSVLEPMESPENNARSLLRIYLKLKNEQYNWYIPQTALSPFLKKHGFTLEESVNSEDYRERYLAGDRSPLLHKGEYLVLAVAD